MRLINDFFQTQKQDDELQDTYFYFKNDGYIYNSWWIIIQNVVYNNNSKYESSTSDASLKKKTETKSGFWLNTMTVTTLFGSIYINTNRYYDCVICHHTDTTQ